MLGCNRNRRRTTLTGTFLALLLSLVLISTTFAARGTWYDLPNKFGADADVIIDSVSYGTFRSTASGRVEIDPSGGQCVYVQAKFTATAAVDGGWFRLAPASNYCNNPRLTFYWSNSYSLAYNGMKFRICKPQTARPDACGSEKSVRF